MNFIRAYLFAFSAGGYAVALDPMKSLRRDLSSSSEGGECQATFPPLSYPNSQETMERCCPCATEANCENLLLSEDTFQATMIEYGLSVGCPISLLTDEAPGQFPAFPELCSYNEAGEIEAGTDISFGLYCFLEFGIESCGFPPDQRRRLNEMKDKIPHHRQVTEHDSGVDIQVESLDSERLQWLSEHIEGMKSKMDSGKIARAWDPLFMAYFKNAKDIELNCEKTDNVIKCASTSMTQCGLDLIKGFSTYHEEIADSIKDQDNVKFMAMHDVPESCN